MHQERNAMATAKTKLKQALQIGYDRGFGAIDRPFELVQQEVYNEPMKIGVKALAT